MILSIFVRVADIETFRYFVDINFVLKNSVAKKLPALKWFCPTGLTFHKKKNKVCTQDNWSVRQFKGDGELYTYHGKGFKREEGV